MPNCSKPFEDKIKCNFVTFNAHIQPFPWETPLQFLLVMPNTLLHPFQQVRRNSHTLSVHGSPFEVFLLLVQLQ